jgi:hypothetical protein
MLGVPAAGAVLQAATTHWLGKITCNLGTLANGASAGITIVVRATKPGTLTNTATVLGNETDPNPSDNSATVSTSVEHPALVTAPSRGQ